MVMLFINVCKKYTEK